MKKLITNLKVLMTLLLLCGVSSAWASTVEFSDGAGWNDTQAAQTYTDATSGITIATSKGVYSGHYRAYKGQTFCVSIAKGNITKIEMTCTASGTAQYGPGCYTLTSEGGAYSYDGTLGTWEGKSQSVTFTASSNQVRMTKIVVTYQVAEGEVASPSFTPANDEFIGSVDVTLTAEEGTKIYYTTDGTDPTTSSAEYTAAITLTATTTVKAIATKDGKASTVASKTYTKVPLLTTLDEIFDKATNVNKTATTVYVTFNNWVISGVTENNAYATDGTKGFVIYQSGHGFEAGDILSGTAKCKVQLYNSSAELTSLTSTTDGLTVTKGGTLTPREVSIAELSGVNTGALIVLNGIRLDNKNVFTDGTDKITVYKTFMTLPEFDAYALTYSITGIYIQYNTTKEIAPRTESDINKNQVAIAIGSTGYATYSSENYTIVPDPESGVQLFGAKINDEGTAVTLIPAPEGQTIGLKGAGYIVKATPNTIAFIEQTGENGNDIEGNQLVGTEQSERTLTQGEAYLLSATSDGTPFFGLCNEGTLAPFKAYLPVSSAVKEVLYFEDATGISTIKNAELNIQDAIYNLAGQKVGADYKGIVIRNGKKMLNK